MRLFYRINLFVVTDLDPEHVGGVDPGEDSEPERLGPVLGAPHPSPTQPEQLRLGEAEARQTRLLGVRGRPGF